MRFLKIDKIYIHTRQITDVRDEGEALEVYLGERSIWLEGEDAEVFRRWLDGNSEDLYNASAADLW